MPQSLTEPPIVVKIGGSTLGSNDTSLQDLVALHRDGKPIVIVHGGGNVISEWMQRQNLAPNFVNGLRVTDAPSLEIVVGRAGRVGEQGTDRADAAVGRAHDWHQRDGRASAAGKDRQPRPWLCGRNRQGGPNTGERHLGVGVHSDDFTHRGGT